ncbi:MAG: acetyl-CoA carboxylase biotin carboxyl carrier protein subunit [Armatimonadetes bacterium]|nr:acetyl-CoA carboxylase biotin carboxyl carrier protein subunit [Armatimonadota bacterium]
MRYLVNGVASDLSPDPSIEVVQAPDRLLVHTPEGTVSALVARAGNKTLVSVGGAQFEIAAVARGGGAAEAAGSGTKLAPMPGLVVDVFVEQDQWVDSGARLLVLEAMKMQHVVTSDVAGTVVALPVSKGQQVSEGDLLVTVGPTDETGNGDKNRGP